jgi:hypothetical protein
VAAEAVAVALVEVAPMAVRLAARAVARAAAEAPWAVGVHRAGPEPEPLVPEVWAAAARAAAVVVVAAVAEPRSQSWVAAGAAAQAGSRTLKGRRS